MKGSVAQKAFTLIELMIVIAITAVLAGLLFPVVASAKRSAKRTEAISNLHQCYVAMHLYAPDETFPDALPNKEILEPYLGTLITCDPSDTWRVNCKAPSTPESVGSYGYVRASVGGLRDQTHWVKFAHIGDTKALLISPFYETPLPPLGSQPIIPMPNALLTLWSDGKIAVSPVTGRFLYQDFTWSSAFVGVSLGRPQLSTTPTVAR